MKGWAVLTVLLFATAGYAAQSRYYQLVPDSKYRGAATDGTDLGAMADFAKIERCAIGGASAAECTGTKPDPDPDPDPDPEPQPEPLVPGEMFAGRPFDLFVRHDGKGVAWFTAKVNGVYATHVSMSNWQAGSVRIAMNPLPVGTHKITIEARNDAGLVGSQTITVRFVAEPALSSTPTIQLQPR